MTRKDHQKLPREIPPEEELLGLDDIQEHIERNFDSDYLDEEADVDPEYE